MRQNTNVLAILGAAGVAVLLAGGCSSSSGSSGDQNTGSTPAAPTSSSAAVSSSAASSSAVPLPTGAGACKYVSTAQAAALAKSSVKPGVSRSIATGPVKFEYCDYIFDPGNSPGVSIAVADLGTTGPALFAALRGDDQGKSDYQVVPGVGDEAFFAGTNLNVRKGNTGLILFVGRSTGSPRGIDALPDEKQLAALILPQV
jgi:hypothetical protein